MNAPMIPAVDEVIEQWWELTPDERVRAFQSLDRGIAGELFLRLDIAEQADLVFALAEQEQRLWLRVLEPDDAADLIQLADEEARDSLINLLDPRSRAQVEALMTYRADVAGGKMTPDYARVPPDMTVEQALAYLRLQARADTPLIYYAYVLDHDGHLLGVISFRDLILASPDRLVRDVMLIDVAFVRADTDQEEVAAILYERELLAVPVVDAVGVMQGIITVDDVMDVVRDEATEDIQKLGGVEALGLSYFRTGARAMFRKRGGWLAVLFVGQMLTVSAMGMFEEQIASAVVLAIFVPLIISSGGNSGSQASTLVIRAMALGEVRAGDWLRVIRRELGVGLALGALLATLGVVRIVTWENLFGTYGEDFERLALTIALSVTAVVVWGTCTGATLPFVLRRFRLDPASASAPLVATVVDVTGLVIYLSIARVILFGGV
ncbi:MAG: magnesium transporter [Dehalococcoidia bacterium]